MNIKHPFTAHPWHGIPVGALAPDIVNAFIEIVPTDTVKYEIDADDGAYPVTCTLYYGNAATCVDTETRVLSILDDEDLMAGALTVYPNPSDGTIHVAAEEPFNWGSFRLYDMSGRLVFEENVPAGPIYDYSLHLSGLARGVYALQYVSFGTALTARVIIFGS